MLLVGAPVSSLAQGETSAAPQAPTPTIPVPSPTPPAKSTPVFEFEAEELIGKGRGPNNVFLQVGELKNPNLLKMRSHFRPEIRGSLNLLP
jgi:hypothetical protein